MLRAIKIIRKNLIELSEKESQKLMNEVNILKKLHHPHIIKLYEFYQDQECFYLVTDLCTGGELFDKITQKKTFSEKEAALIMKQILSAVSYCHSHNVVHRDLKPENVLFTSTSQTSSLKIIDFGTSKIFKPKEKLHEGYGSPYYVAPEVIAGDYTEKCDIWSCGVILFMLLSGRAPFNGATDDEILEKVATGVYELHPRRWGHISKEAKDLVCQLLEVNTERRVTAATALKHPWFDAMAKLKEEDIRPEAFDDALQSLKTYRAGRKLQQALWLFFVQHFSRKEEHERLLAIFGKLDQDGDGKITLDELREGFREVTGSTLTAGEANELMNELGDKKSTSIDYTRFAIAAINKRKLITKKKVEQAFNLFDQDGDGLISLEEFKKGFAVTGLQDEAWKKMIKEFDRSGDCKISFREFKLMMQGLMGDDPKLKDSNYQLPSSLQVDPFESNSASLHGTSENCK